MVDSALKYLPLLLFLGWVWRRGLSNVGVADALAYWMRDDAAGDHFDSRERVVRYLREAYDSGLYLGWLDRMLLIVGLCGCLLTGAIILVNGWYGVRGAAIPGGLNAYILPAAACILLPVLVLRWGSWRFPLKQRRSAAIARIFGGETRAIGFAQSLRRLPHKPGRVSLWAFPMGAGGWLTRFDGAASWAIFAILMTLFFQAGNVPELLTGAISVIALLFLPVNITGFGMAFGKWKVAHDMTYPLAIFFDDMDHLT